MPIHCPRNARERILVYGTTGTSKTHSWFNIADWHQRTKSTARFLVLDTDNSVTEELEEGYPHLTNVEIFPTFNYTDFSTNLDKATAFINPDDWLVVDMVGELWEMAQRHFTDQVFNRDIESHFLAMRAEMQRYNESRNPNDKQKTRLNPLEGFTDWPTINKLNQGIMDRLCLRNTSHVYCTSKAQALNSQDDEQNQDVYGRYGFRPQGQKFLGHYFRSIFFTQKAKTGWRINSVKDRNRPLLEGTELTNFTMQYLKEVAGWQLV